MKFLSILAGKITIIAGNILHRGSSLPGKIALKIDKNLLNKLKYPDIRIAVTGSSGKGSTSSLIAKVLKDNGYKICFNDKGSNLAWGCTTSFLRNVSLTGKIKADILLIEIDERYTKEMFPCLKPTHIVVTNLTKDQPPRQHNVDIVYQDILKGVTANSKIVTNIDEPYLRNFERDTKNEMIYFSLDKNKYSYRSQIFENLNTYYCPYCKEKLEYEYYNFETLGKYHCTKCGFKNEHPKVLATNLDLEEETIEINDKKINIGGNFLYHAYNTIAAYTTLKDIGLEENKIVDSINKFNKYSTYSYELNNKVYIPISCKAENASTYNQAIFKTIMNKEKKDIILGWKEISRRYNHFDISWLYDIEFELLNNESLNKVYAVGIDAENIKKRLILAGIDEDKILLASSIPEIKDKVNNDEIKYVYGILNFDYIEPFKETFKEDEE